jgi:hypothetical protein
METADKDASAVPTAPEEMAEATVPRNVRWDPSDLERIERAAKVLSARERLKLSAADIIRRGTMKEVDEILRAA